MPKLNERGAIQFIVLLLLLIGLGAGVWLVTAGPLNIFPKASVSGPVGPSTAFVLSPNLSNVGIGATVGVKIAVRSDIAASNLFVAKLNFNRELLAVERIDYSSTLVSNWVEQFSDNSTGEVSLVGGVPAPGLQTNASGPGSPMAVVYFKALKAGSASITFSADSAIYSNADNINILTRKDPLAVNVIAGATAVPSPTAVPSSVPSTATLAVNPTYIGIGTTFSYTWAGVQNPAIGDYILTYNSTGVKQDPIFWTNDCTKLSSAPAKASGTCSGMTLQLSAGTYYMKLFSNINNQLLATSNNFTITTVPLPSATPRPGTGDGNNDGKVNLVDLSVMLTDWQKRSGFRVGIDLNADGFINTLDLSLMFTILRQNGVIRG